ncbi:MAG: iron-containing alcohol dehydrogenase [Bacteroidia bacterium]|nr:iron-containing alcohol dehydrogenase [Bacteroidia bacterium]
MVKEFQLTAFPRLFFGEGKLMQLPEILREYGPWVLILTGKKSFLEGENWKNLQAALRKEGIIWSHAAIEGEPNPRMIDQIVNDHRDSVVDAIVAIGGGSVMDAGKAISAMLCENGSVKDFLEGVGTRKPSGEKIPFIAVPTTAGTGSEATKNAVISEPGINGFKKSLRHDNFIPDVALADPKLALGLSEEITAYTGMDAFTQLLEAYVSTKANPLTDALAEQGLAYIKLGLESAVKDAGNSESRAYMAYAAFLSGVCLANAGLGLVHGFASVIGGILPIPHGLVCARLMGPVNRLTVEKLIEETPEALSFRKYQKAGEIMGFTPGKSDMAAKFLVEEIERFSKEFELARFGDFGLKHDELDLIIERSSPKNHPLDLTKEEWKQILKECI